MKYQPRLDGIRALAVLAVLGFHATDRLPGGWIGVDIFFVLSGYLITRILRAELADTGRINLGRFYLKRAGRLVPALLATVTISIPIMIALPDERTYPVWAVTIGSLFYAANWMQVVDPVSLGPLTHTWSLAIEEQFYLVWPFVLILLFRHRIRAQTATIGAVALTLIVARTGYGVLTDGAWFATTSRADALLIGALLAFAPLAAPRLAALLLVGGASALGAFALTGHERSAFMLDGGLTLVALAAAALIAGALGSNLAKPLSWRPLVALGQVSYGVYLYHYPVFFLVNYTGMPALPGNAVKVLLTAALVIASWFLLERPVLRAVRGRVSRGQTRGEGRGGYLRRTAVSPKVDSDQRVP